jgi:uncharacterized protein YjiS (DUF1127 family)
MYADANSVPTALSRPLSIRLSSYAAALVANHRARIDRTRLSEMSDHILRDIGLTRGDVRHVSRSLDRRF